MYGNYIHTLTDSVNDKQYIVQFFFIKLKAAFIYDHFLLGVGLKRIVLSGYFFLIYLFVILYLALNLKLRSGGICKLLFNTSNLK